MNNRDHRKITVVDNRVAFTGGVNISDEYINRHRRFGYWKDSAIMIEGGCSMVLYMYVLRDVYLCAWHE